VDGRRLSRDEGSLGVEPGSQGSAGTRGAALPSLHEPQPVRPAGFLHAARLGVEEQPDRHLHELEPERFVRRVQGREVSSATPTITLKPAGAALRPPPASSLLLPKMDISCALCRYGHGQVSRLGPGRAMRLLMDAAAARAWLQRSSPRPPG